MMYEECLILCNRDHPIPEDYTVDLHTLPSGIRIDRRMLLPYEALLAELKENGYAALALDAYRTWELQEKIMRERIRQHQSEGHTYEEAKVLAERLVAVAGTSEHQLGLALDIEPADGEEEKGLYDWLAQNAHRHGFILRYPADKTQVTKIDYEPWHFRYVGPKAAQEIFERRICLEEYLEENEA